jgi:TonB-dependent starch-binding outer membrane protein SusC
MNNFSFNQRAKLIRFLCSLTLLLHCLNSQAMQQQTQKTITGTVKDTQGIIPGVTIYIKGKTSGTFSDENGKFSIQGYPTDILVFSYVGYRTIEIAIASQTVINILLEEDTTQLKEVILNAGYYTVKDKETTGSIARITAKDIETQPVTNVLATMQGRMAGVNITQTSGVPGGGFDIKIRGQNSLRADGNIPLYLIDGVPYSSEVVGNGRSTGVLPTLANPLNSINPNDIESIEVLKDADATAIYGSRGANGVVLITTKKGKQGKTQFSANLSKGSGKVTRFVDLLNTEQYLDMRAQAFANDGITDYPATAYDINGTWDQNRYTDWQKELLGGTVDFTDLQTTISGGNNQTQFLVSGTYHNETTVFRGEFGYKRGVIRSNLNHSSTNNKFKINLSSAYTNQNNNQPASDLTRIARSLAPNAPALYQEDGSLNWEDSTWENPLALLEGKYLTNTTDFILNTMLGYTLYPGIEIKSNFGITDLNHTETRTQPSTIYDPAYEAGPEFSVLTSTSNRRKSWIIEPQISWDKKWKYGKTNFLLGATFQQQKGVNNLQEAEGFSSNSLIYNPAAATTVDLIHYIESDYKYNAFFGRLNYSLHDRYFINLTGRRDGSSRFGPGKQYGNFGAIGVAWIFTEEAILKNQSPIFSFGKLRMSYGSSGNDQIGDYQFIDTYATSTANYGSVNGLQPSRLYNPDFAWETNQKLEIALEAGFLNDRIFFTLGWYANKSTNQLIGIPLPGTTGFPSILGNLNAEVQNRGIEFSLKTINIKLPNFSWITNYNVSFNENELIAFPNLEASTFQNQYVIGQPLNIRKVYQYTGIDPQTGIYTFADLNNDGQINAVGDRQMVADLNPKYFGGLQNQLTGNWIFYSNL